MASNEMHLSPKETMQICQKLYEGGHITYMRTDSTTYSADFIQSSADYITKEYGLPYFNQLNITNNNINNKNDTKIKENLSSEERKEEKNIKINNKIKKKTICEEADNADAAHEAIRPTDIACKELELDETIGKKEIKMYTMIRRNTLESLMNPATYKSLNVSVSAPTALSSTSALKYTYSTEQVIFPGWQIVGGYELVNKDFAYLQTLTTGRELNYKKVVAKITMKNVKSHYTEARLVQLLEKQGIGRPSTFAALIDKIQERGYVKKENIKGLLLKCTDFELVGEELTQVETEREFGNEKNKLVLQPLGTLVLDFLLNHFEPLFQYTYTKEMEDSLDLIASGAKIWHELCQTCLDAIETLTQTVLVNSSPPSPPSPKLTDGRLLGSYNGHEIILKNGKFGYYIEYGELKKAVRIGLKTPEEVTLEEMVALLNDNDQDATSAIVRKITEEISIRKGKFGDYIFYKKKDSKKPQFFKLKTFTDDYKNCNISILKKWLKETYSI
jgi:DNA topoisomerase-1